MRIGDHEHVFASWPFAESVETAAFTTTPVLEGREPVRLVSHDNDGDWQFLCDTTVDAADCRMVCLGCALEHDDTLRTIADLPKGWYAVRAGVGQPWTRAPRPVEWDEEP
jgi:hypothetical protein